jgi:hypothetical protein
MGRKTIPFILAALLVFAAALLAARSPAGGKAAAGRGEVLALARGIGQAIRAAEDRGSALPAGPLSDRTYQALRALNGALPPMERLWTVIQLAQVGADEGDLAGKGPAVLLQGRRWTSFVAATADGIYECTVWWTGCTRIE